MSNDSPYLLRTHCAVFNHESYILDALKGFAMQQTTFPVVYTILDDASTDRSPELLRQFVAESFDLGDGAVGYDKETEYGHVTFARHKTNLNCYFAVVYLKENHYSQKKSKAPYLTEWTGTKYYAICEGDDYWTDPYKLQKQVDFMEQHPDFVACFHNARVQYKDHTSLFNGLEENHFPSTEDIIKRQWFIATPTLLYRNIVQKPEWSRGVVNGDYLLELLLAKEGRFCYMDDVMAVYRKHGEGMSSRLNKNQVDMVDKLIDLLEKMKVHYGGEHAVAFDESIRNYQEIRANYAKEAYYEQHPVARAFRPKTYKRMIKKKLRKWLKS